MKNTKPKFKIGDRVRISKNDIPFRKGHKPQFTDKFWQYLQKHLPHISSKQKRFWENFMRKS